MRRTSALYGNHPGHIHTQVVLCSAELLGAVWTSDGLLGSRAFAIIDLHGNRRSACTSDLQQVLECHFAPLI